MPQELEKPKQMDSLEVFNDNDRIFKCWGTVEIRDKAGDLLPIDEFKKMMPVIMKRGGPITDRHSNRVVGKILGFEFKENPIYKAEGLLLTGMIFNDYNFDDKVWTLLKDGFYSGMSFGGLNQMKDVTFNDEGMMVKVLKSLEGFEFALVPSTGNQGALMDSINFVAKTGQENDEEAVVKAYELVNKPFAGYENFDSCVRANKDKSDAKAYCASIMHKVEDDTKKTDLATDSSWGCTTKGQTPNDSNLTTGQSNTETLKYNVGLEKSDMTAKEVAKEGEMPGQAPMAPAANSLEDRVAKLEAIVAQMQQGQAAAQSSVAKTGDGEKVILPEVPAEKVQGKDTTTPSDKVNMVEKIGEEVKKAIGSMKSDIVDEIKKSFGNVKSSETPRPGVGTDNFINKGASTKVKGPTNFREANAMHRKLTERKE